VAFLLFLLASLAALAPFGSALSRTVSAPSRASLDEVAEGLTCQCGCGLTVANCNHPMCSFSVPVREQIEKMLNSGLTKHQILEQFRAKYGEKVLSSPQPEGFNLLAWVMPFAAIFFGAAVILIVLARWRARPSKPIAEANESVQGYDVKLRYRLRREVERLG
jgi:cytochrome c-type biogenesis protein CcmH